jgi:hypothetical protein
LPEIVQCFFAFKVAEDDGERKNRCVTSSNFRILSFIGILGFALVGGFGCMSAYKKSIGADTEKSLSRIYNTEFNTAWQAALDALKSFRLDISNREAGFLQTRWTDNTGEKHLRDTFGSAQSYLKAQFRFRLNVDKGYFNGVQSIKVTVLKEQVAQRDVLEGFVSYPTDTVEENTLLYRIGRLISVRTKLDEQEQKKTEKQLEETTEEEF